MTVQGVGVPGEGLADGDGEADGEGEAGSDAAAKVPSEAAAETPPPLASDPTGRRHERDRCDDAREHQQRATTAAPPRLTLGGRHVPFGEDRAS